MNDLMSEGELMIGKLFRAKGYWEHSLVTVTDYFDDESLLRVKTLNKPHYEDWHIINFNNVYEPLNMREVDLWKLLNE